MSEYANYDDYNDPEEENEYDATHGKKLTVGKIIGKTLLYGLRLAAFSVIAILLWRIFSGGVPKSMQSYIWTDEAYSIYTAAPDDYSIYHYKRNDNLSKDGKFMASYVYYVKETGEFQITLRYNNSTLKKLAADYSLDSLPENEPFVFTLTDQNGKVYTEYEYSVDKKNLYNYRKLIFKGIDMAPLTVKPADPDRGDDEINREKEEKAKVKLTLKVFYADDVLFSAPYSELTVFDYAFYHEEVSPAYKKNQMSFTDRQEYTVKEEPEETTEG